MNTFEGLVKWLHACIPAGYTPQLGLADEGKQALVWLPGRRSKPAGVQVDSSRVKFLGCTNRAYQSVYEAMESQRSAITCAMVDIDHGDQNAELQKPNRLVAAVSEAISDDLGLTGSLRSSCGGLGLHVLFRLSAPVLLPANPGRGAHTAITQHILRPLVQKIEAAGVHVCKSDSRMFWLWGGANEGLMTTERLLDVDPRLLRGEAPDNPHGRVHQIGRAHV